MNKLKVQSSNFKVQSPNNVQILKFSFPLTESGLSNLKNQKSEARPRGLAKGKNVRIALKTLNRFYKIILYRQSCI